MTESKNLQITVVGSLNADRFLRVDRMPAEGETLFAKGFVYAFGGKGANTAVAAGKMNTSGSTYMLGQVGDDGDGETYIEHFNSCNVKNDHIRKVKGVATGSAYIISNTKTGENSIIVVGGANLTYGNDDIVELSEEWTKVIQSSNVLLLQREIPEKINIAAAMAAKTCDKKVLVVLDMGGQDEPVHPTLITLCDMISPNTTELKRLINMDPRQTTHQNIKRFLQKYNNLAGIVLKDGEKGSEFHTQEKVIHVDAFLNKDKQYKVIDTVGAGDTFTGAFAVRYAETNGDIKESLKFGNYAAFLSITKLGAGAGAVPSREKVDDLVDPLAAKMTKKFGNLNLEDPNMSQILGKINSNKATTKGGFTTFSTSSKTMKQ